VLNEDKHQAILSDETISKLEDEYNILMNEQYVIENETNKETLLNVAQSVINCDMKLSRNGAISMMTGVRNLRN
jgi:hypothetical protein